MIDKKIEEAKEEIYEDRFLLNGEEVVFDNAASAMRSSCRSRTSSQSSVRADPGTMSVP